MRNAWYRLAVFAAMALAFAPAWAGPATVDAMALTGSGPQAALALDLSEPSQYRLFTLSNPERIVIDILAARLTRQALPLPAGAGAVRQVRAANRPDGSLRIVLDTAEAVEARGAMQRAPRGKGSRLLIDLTVRAGTVAPAVARVDPDPVAPAGTDAAQTGPAAAASASPAPALPAPAPVVEEPRPPVAGSAPRTPAARPDRPAKGRDIVVAVDAGHGGKDSGAHGPHGVLEKDVTLRLARQLAEVINAEPGMRAVLTRDRDEFIPLRGRMERARAVSADLFISVHADAVYNREVQGGSVYVLNEKGATDEAARRLAARENAADLIGGVSLRTKDPVLASVLMDLSQNAALSSSIEVADEILRQMARVGTVRKPQVMQAPFMVLKSPDVPSVLIETAYISNPEEERRLDSNEYRGRLATAIFTGVREYFYRNPPRGSLVADLGRQQPAESVEHVIRRGETLGDLASRYNVSIRRIRDANRLHSDRLAPGQVLRIPAPQET
ncbi:MAG: N-acetylmuramoyl-L-alanine amidase [Gammaproteobacteria bacterium]|nr:N-acetylmuramoyl-L-alanine amidase [Gammaproteobacteria bacterium]